MAMYGKVEYWNARYSDTSLGPYDWYQSYSNLRQLLSLDNLMATTKLGSMTSFPHQGLSRVLILGCGNSTFGEDMLRDGWNGEIVNVDFSPVVIEQMNNKYNDDFYKQLGLPRKMKFICADVTKTLPFPDKSFDLIVCKGTFDAILCSSGAVANAKRLVKECSRLLVHGHGIFFLVSYGNPDSRIVFLEHENDLSYYWQEVSTQTVARSGYPKNDYVYICRKRADVTERRAVSTQHESGTPANAENVAGRGSVSLAKVNDRESNVVNCGPALG